MNDDTYQANQQPKLENDDNVRSSFFLNKHTFPNIYYIFLPSQVKWFILFCFVVLVHLLFVVVYCPFLSLSLPPFLSLSLVTHSRVCSVARASSSLSFCDDIKNNFSRIMRLLWRARVQVCVRVYAHGTQITFSYMFNIKLRRLRVRSVRIDVQSKQWANKWANRQNNQKNITIKEDEPSERERERSDETQSEV